MANALQLKLLAAILAVLGVIAAIMVRHSRPIEIDRQAQKKVEHMVQPPRAYVVP